MKVEVRASTITKLANIAIRHLRPEWHGLTLDSQHRIKEARDLLRAQFVTTLNVPRKLHRSKDMKDAMD